MHAVPPTNAPNTISIGPNQKTAAEPTEQAISASVWHRPVATLFSKKQLASRQANAAAALLRLGSPDNVWPLFRGSCPDPTLRSLLIHRIPRLGVAANIFLRQLDDEKDGLARRAVVLVLGQFALHPSSEHSRREAITKLSRLYCR